MEKEIARLQVNTPADLFNLIEDIQEHFTIKKHDGIWIAQSNNYEIILKKS